VAGQSHSALVFTELLALLNGQLADYDDAIAEAVQRHPDAPIFSASPASDRSAPPYCSPRSVGTATTESGFRYAANTLWRASTETSPALIELTMNISRLRSIAISYAHGEAVPRSPLERRCNDVALAT